MSQPEKLSPDGKCPCGNPIVLVKSMGDPEELAVIKSRLLRILPGGTIVARCKVCKRDVELPNNVLIGKSLRFVVKKRQKGQ